MTGRGIAQGEVGIVEVKGPNIFQGYWRNPEKTKAEFRADGYFITGDERFLDLCAQHPREISSIE